MKKFLDIIIVIIIFFIIYFLQANFFTWFNILGIMPNVFVILIVLIGLFINEKFGAIFGIVFGLLLDFFVGSKIGINAISFMVVGYMSGKLEKNISKNSRISMIYLITILSLISEVITYVLRSFCFQVDLQILSFLKIILIEILYNIFLVIIFYPLIFNFGNKLEDDFTNRKKFSKLFNLK